MRFDVQLAASDETSREAVEPEIAPDDGRRWWALAALCLGMLVVTLDSTIVTVALPSLGADLHVTEAALTWVMNAYVATFCGFLIFGGSLGDFFGPRRIFLLAIASFTLASLACGLAGSMAMLIIARALQGIAGAVVSGVIFSLIMSLFTDIPKRSKALGMRSFVCASGSIVGLLLGGVVTGTLGWRFIFFMNIPVGAFVFGLCWKLLPRVSFSHRRRVDAGGAATITLSLILATYAIVDESPGGWNSGRKPLLLAGALLALAMFVVIQSRVGNPLIPLRLIRRSGLIVAATAGAFISGALLAWNFAASLYMQTILKFSPMQVGFAFVPAEAAAAVMALGLVSWLVTCLGGRRSFLLAAAACALGLLLLARGPLSADMIANILPGMLLMGLGSGLVYNPLLLCALNGVPAGESGVVSGIFTTACGLGGTLGLAIAAAVAAAGTHSLSASGLDLPLATNSGYHMAFYTATGFVGIAALIGGFYLRIEDTVR